MKALNKASAKIITNGTTTSGILVSERAQKTTVNNCAAPPPVLQKCPFVAPKSRPRDIYTLLEVALKPQ